ncbi:hypothetical protein U1872_04860 [Sphingomonas sp. RB3P16]|uniref:hypothetical protein n=1 Tax=Parasphingomonas frigoris TaxID=3096163 RepID=UPI002FC6C460
MAMSPEPELEPDPQAPVLKVGQDCAGHWLVQESGGRLEGRFVSKTAALGFARSERHSLPGAIIEIATTPLVPIVAFTPVEPWETAQHVRKAA